MLLCGTAGDAALGQPYGRKDCSFWFHDFCWCLFPSFLPKTKMRPSGTRTLILDDTVSSPPPRHQQPNKATDDTKFHHHIVRPLPVAIEAEPFSSPSSSQGSPAVTITTTHSPSVSIGPSAVAPSQAFHPPYHNHPSPAGTNTCPIPIPEQPGTGVAPTVHPRGIPPTTDRPVHRPDTVAIASAPHNCPMHPSYPCPRTYPSVPRPIKDALPFWKLGAKSFIYYLLPACPELDCYTIMPPRGREMSCDGGTRRSNKVGRKGVIRAGGWKLASHVHFSLHFAVVTPEPGDMLGVGVD
ncbi:hypothetical protein QBC39DRAFT_362344 [Podospora conica]|nr:hypothetical protein QBC39DRAFT_362344 [Schizothecium conicum]